MHKLIRPFLYACIAACVCFVSPRSAQAAESLTYFDTAGRYADLQKEAERRLAAGEPANAFVIGYLCIAYGKLQAFDKLFQCADRLDEIIARGDFKLELDQRVMFISASDARALPSVLRARAWFDLGDYAKARADGAKAVALLAQLPEVGGTSAYPTIRLRISALEVMAISSARLGEMDTAKKLAAQMENLSYGFIGGRMWGWLKDNALGQVYMAVGQYDEALKHLPETTSMTKALVSFVNGLGPYGSQGDSATSIIEQPRLVMRGKALAETGKTEEARKAFDELLASPRIKDIGSLYWVVLYERGRIAQSQRQLEQAATLYKSAIDVVETQRASISGEASKIGFVGDKQALYGQLIDVLYEQGAPAQALEYVERSKSRALVDMLATRKSFNLHGADPAEVQKILATLDAANMSQPPPEAPAAEGKVASANADPSMRSANVARQDISRAAPELSTLVSVAAVSLDDLKPLMRDEEVLVEYYYHGDTLYAFILNQGKLSATKLNGDGLQDEVQLLRTQLTNPDTTDWQKTAQSLYRRLWQPLEREAQGQRAIVVPHGVLHYLPFAVLQKPDGSLLLDRTALRFLPSASVLKYLKPVLASKQAPLLVFGNPDLNDARLDLKFAEEEARAVAAMTAGSRILLRKDASETNLKRAVGAFARVHFATHGQFRADDPLSSGLYLAKDAENDGVLTVGELYTLNVDIDLVTLSACETGLGKVVNGDDVVGLTRGFMYAGSRSILASLWSVDDNATSELMKSFYSNLAHSDKQHSLRDAQLKVRASFPHPFYWAAFQLSGRAD